MVSLGREVGRTCARTVVPLILVCTCAALAHGQGSEASLPLLAPVSTGESVPLPAADPDLPSPAALLGRPLGLAFHHQAELAGVAAKLAASSPRVKLLSYGETHQGRPLQLLAISSRDNIQQLEDVRRKNLRLANPQLLSPAEEASLIADQPVVVWLAYGVHGNEASSAEAAIATAYLLAAATGSEWERLLRDVVVLIDPLSNPDGRERYLSAFENRRGREPNPDPAAAEHAEPWPGGRTNHYQIDLNRDWAWITQRETRARIAAYRSFEPQVYVDFHEMGSGSSYYFPPVAPPIHPAIDPRVVKWLEIFGRANARAFDEMGWLYFNGQRYDLFYPGYGDSYPSLRGSIGMTYEMAGGGRAGEALRLPDGSLLTLADRVARHTLASLSTVRAAVQNRSALLADFALNRRSAIERPAQSFLWDAEQPEARALAELLIAHGLEVRELSADAELAALSQRRGAEERRRFRAGTFVASTAQPHSRLLTALMTADTPVPETFLERQRRRVEESLDSEFYDITAWSLPLAYNLDTYVLTGEPPGARVLQPASGGLSGSGGVAYLLPPRGLESYRFAARLEAEGVRYRLALVGFEIGGTAYPSGTLVIPSHGNAETLGERLAALASQEKVTLERAASSMTASGVSLGSDDVVAVRPTRVGLVGGPGTTATAFGALWSVLDEAVGLGPERLPVEDFTDRLKDLDVLVLPDGGGYGDQSPEVSKKLERWVKDGGILVALGQAVTWLSDAKLIEVKAWEPPKQEDEDRAEGGASLPALASRPLETPGAALRTRLRTSHPLAAGLASDPPVLFEGSTILLPTLKPEETVLTVASATPVAAGVVWEEAQQRLTDALLVGALSKGKGKVILFAQDPVFRSFWRGTMPLFLNAVMFGGSW